ncbi:MAG: hypothetical protein JSU04_17600 [Bdellovibrionales bacterium]|nr:hypothetical protein [Bdellovibrionales bacterium]
MYRHIDDAMILNQARAPIYNRLSNGESAIVSEAMISFEKGLLRSASLADAAAFPFQLSGIPILCVDYIHMSETPSFRNSFAQGAPKLSQFHPLNIQSVKTALTAALQSDDFESMIEIATQSIEELNKEPRFNCMVRHFLESARRIAGLAPQYQVMAGSRLSAYGTKFISKKILKGHIKSLDEAARIDLLSAPVQAQNIPIVCQDVPHIPTAPNLLQP